MKRILAIALILLFTSPAFGSYKKVSYNLVSDTTASLLSRNADIVLVAPYDTVLEAAGNTGTGGTVSTENLQYGHIYRFRQAGTVTKIKIYTPALTNLTAIYYKVWRKLGTTYYLIGTSENILASCTAAQSNTITLTSPIAGVREGDYYGLRLESSSSSAGVLTQRTGQTNAGYYYITNATPDTTNYAWESQSTVAGNIIPVEAYMQAPHVVFIGDSHFGGIDDRAYVSNVVALSRQFQSLPYYFQILSNFTTTYQNMGINGQTSANLVARFTADVVNLAPRYVVISSGTVDIVNSVTQADYIANMTTMLDAAVAGNIVPIVMSLPPRTGFTTAQSQSRDAFNIALKSLIAGYGTAKYVDLDPILGQFRSGGDAGNYWDFQTKYDIGDNVHFSPEGNWAVAKEIAYASGIITLGTYRNLKYAN